MSPNPTIEETVMQSLLDQMQAYLSSCAKTPTVALDTLVDLVTAEHDGDDGDDGEVLTALYMAVRKTLKELTSEGLVENYGDDVWAATYKLAREYDDELAERIAEHASDERRAEDEKDREPIDW